LIPAFLVEHTILASFFILIVAQFAFMLSRFSRARFVAKAMKSNTLAAMINSCSIRRAQSATEWKTKLASLHGSMDVKETKSLYDDWAKDYDSCLQEWGYKVPDITADLLKENLHRLPKTQQLTLFDIGCGTGLVGKCVQQISDTKVTVHGCDLSDGQFPFAREKGYAELKTWDLNAFPYPYETSSFDVLTCCGTLTYAQDFVKIFKEWTRITKPGGLIICTHRSDMMERDIKFFEQMETKKIWKKIKLTDSVPYLPNNENYGSKVQVQFYVAQSLKE